MIGSPSSLVFAAIVGVWAVYLVPMWLRRRHELAEARDAEVRAARVLAPRRRSTVTTAAASTGPVLHRGRPGTAPTSAPSSPTSSPAQPPAEPGEPDAAPDGPPTEQLPVITAKAARTAPAGAAKPAGHGAVRPPRSVQEVAARAAARRRARVLAILLLGSIACWGAVGLSLAPVVAALPVTALLLLDLVALRAAARRRAARAAGPAATSPVVAGPATARPARSRRPATAPRREPVAPPQVSGEPVADPYVEPEPVAVPEPAAGIGWTPVPVPVPLYTLKPVAPSRWTLPARPVAVADPVPAAVEEDLAPMGLATLDLDAVLERRRAVNG